MMDKPEQRALMTRYLFGEVSEDERVEFEDTYLRDNSVFQELVSLENEIIDRYVLGELPYSERQRFERFVLSHPGRRESVEIARFLLAQAATAETAIAASAQPTHKPRLFAGLVWQAQIAVAGAFLLMITGICALMIVNRRLNSEVPRMQTKVTRTEHDQEELQRQVDNLKATLQQRDNTLQQLAELQNDRGIISLTLNDDVARGDGEPRRLTIPAKASKVSLHLIMDRDTQSRYNVSLKTAEGRPVWHLNGIRGQLTDDEHQEIIALVPAHLFNNGDYVIRVSKGRESILDNVAGFSFHAVKQ